MVNSAPLALRDVFVPHVLEPNARSVWKIGNHYNVTWCVFTDIATTYADPFFLYECRDVTKAPKHITNEIGMIVLSNNGSLLLGTWRNAK